MTDPKETVRSGYDRCAHAYAEARLRGPRPDLARLAAMLPPAPRLLDIGCGAGLPLTATLCNLGSVTGVDISSAQIDLARRNVPSARFIHGDIMAQTFEPASFDAVVSFYTLFHLPREEHAELISRVTRWLTPRGCLMATLPRTDGPDYVEHDFFGVTMYWSHYETRWYRERLEAAGFEILHLASLGHGYGDRAGQSPEYHPLVIARLGTPARAGD